MVLVIEMNYFFIVTTLRSCVLVVDVTADGNNNEVEETMEVGDIMMYPFS